MKSYLAIEIDTPKAFELVVALDPTYRQLKFDEVIDCFLVLHYPIHASHSIIPPEALGDVRLETTVPIKMFNLIKE